MMAVPADKAVTSPVELSTDATEGSLEDQLILWSVASEGLTEAVSVAVSPYLRVRV